MIRGRQYDFGHYLTTGQSLEGHLVDSHRTVELQSAVEFSLTIGNNQIICDKYVGGRIEIIGGRILNNFQARIRPRGRICPIAGDKCPQSGRSGDFGSNSKNPIVTGKRQSGILYRGIFLRGSLFSCFRSDLVKPEVSLVFIGPDIRNLRVGLNGRGPGLTSFFSPENNLDQLVLVNILNLSFFLAG